jgi:hypothetical protein
MSPRFTNEDLEEKNAMGIRTADQQYVYLRTGQLFFTAGPALVEAVLGSSLAVVMLTAEEGSARSARVFCPGA